MNISQHSVIKFIEEAIKDSEDFNKDIVNKSQNALIDECRYYSDNLKTILKMVKGIDNLNG